jgi:hypothetical protein
VSVLEVADILRAAGPELCDRLAVLPSQKRALQAILDCRTSALGGSLYGCEQCGALHFSYHSCGNRHCPKCHGQQTQQWLDKQRSLLLPCPYFLLTFTLPSELRALARSHQKLVYDLLLKTAAATIQSLCEDPQWLDAQPALMGFLHTWTRAMLYHLHAHFLVSAGGLSPDGLHWQEPKNPNFLLPVHALSKIFRAKMRQGLQQAGCSTQLPEQFWDSHKKWVVHAQSAGSGQKVLDYLARYVFRIAISNSRLDALEKGQVTFHYRDNRTHQLQSVQLSAEQFIERFLQHVLPKGFAKVRYYGLSSSACQPRRAQARSLLPCLPAPPAPILTLTAGPASPTADDGPRCPRCRTGRLIYLGELLPWPEGPVLIIPLTSRGRRGPCMHLAIPP